MEVCYFPHEVRLLSELKAKGFEPAVVYDIGASTGVWSETIADVFPQAEYHLFEPLAELVDAYRTDMADRLLRLPNLKLHPFALGDTNGKTDMFVPQGDPYSSSVHLMHGVPAPIQVTRYRLDDYVAESGLPPPDVIKMDCQGAEDTILNGGKRALRNAKVLFLETWLRRGYGPKTPLLGEIIEFLRGFSFSPVEIGERFYDDKHRLYSIDVAFFSESLLERTHLSPLERDHEASSSKSEPLLPAANAPQNMTLSELAQKLLALTASSGGDLALSAPSREADRPQFLPRDADVIVTHVEINRMHGVGALMLTLFFGTPNILSIRSKNQYDGDHALGDAGLLISHETTSRDAVFSRVLNAMGSRTVRRVLCVPYLPDDVRTALAVKEIFGVPICTYLTDDQNICVDGIPDDLMRELLAKSALRLAISPELCIAYELKYGCRVWYMPPVIPAGLILSRLNVPPTVAKPNHGVIVGNIWGRHWLALLRETVRKSGVRLSWYCNGGFSGLPCNQDDLIADSIVPHEPPSDEELVQILRRAWYAVLPSGTLDEKDDRRFIGQLSLPSRMIYLLTTAQLPILVLGSRDTAAAHFVEQFGIGSVTSYDRGSFIKAVESITQPEANLAMRRRALAVAGRFTDVGAAEWIWQSLALGRPIDQRYEDLMPEKRPDLSHLLARKGPHQP